MDKSFDRAQNEGSTSGEAALRMHGDVYTNNVQDKQDANTDNTTAGAQQSWGVALSKSPFLLSRNLESQKSLSEALPSSSLGKAQVVLSEAASSVLPAAGDALFGVHHLSIPFSSKILGKETSIAIPKILESAALGAAIGFSTRSILPQAGLIGRMGGAALAFAFTAPFAKQSFDIYNDINKASNMSELRQSGRNLGATIGSLAVNLPVGIASYKLGVYASDRLMPAPASIAKTSENSWTDNNNKASELVKQTIAGEKLYANSQKNIEQLTRLSWQDVPPGSAAEAKVIALLDKRMGGNTSGFGPNINQYVEQINIGGDGPSGGVGSPHYVRRLKSVTLGDGPSGGIGAPISVPAILRDNPGLVAEALQIKFKK